MFSKKYTCFPRTIAVILTALVTLFVLFPVAVNAATYTEEIELETRSILMVDRSGSIKDIDAVNAILASLDMDAYDAVMYFDAQDFSLNPEYAGRGNSPICEAVDAAATGGFTHITIVTDGEQWPAKYGALKIYTDINLRIIIVEGEAEAAEALAKELPDHFVKSTIAVQWPNGETQVLMDEYQPHKYVVEFEVPDPVVEQTTIVECNHECAPCEHECVPCTHECTPCTHVSTVCTHRCLWWLALLLACLFALLLWLLHWLFGHHRRGWFGPVVTKVKKGARMVLDVSGSMGAYSGDVVRAARKGKATDIIAFGETVEQPKLDEVSKLNIGGATKGVEALKKAAELGWKEVILISDLYFNGECLNPEDFKDKKFKKLTILAPAAHDNAMVGELKKIADQVEVLSL